MSDSNILEILGDIDIDSITDEQADAIDKELVRGMLEDVYFVAYYFVKSMKLKSCLSLSAVSILCAFSFGVDAVNPSTTADAYGNWQSPAENNYWRVVDPDPQGLNCRMRGAIGDILALRERGVALAIGEFWTQVTLPEGYVFPGAHYSFNDALIYDDRGLPWVYNTDDECFVRANSAFIVPVRNRR